MDCEFPSLSAESWDAACSDAGPTRSGFNELLSR